MAAIYDVDPSELIERAAIELKKIESIMPPEWAIFAKTGVSKERPPAKEDWWYMRAASVLRAVYKLGPIGVSKLRTRYGGKKNRGAAPGHFYKASGNILRKILQQLEKEGFIKKVEKGVHKGREITPKGEKFLNDLAKNLKSSEPKAKEPKHEKIPKEAAKEEKPKVEVKPKKPKVEEKIPTAAELAEKKDG